MARRLVGTLAVAAVTLAVLAVAFICIAVAFAIGIESAFALAAGFATIGCAWCVAMIYKTRDEVDRMRQGDRDAEEDT